MTHCARCGADLSADAHVECTQRLELEPPRFCTMCGRRMVVQVTPTSWTATCSVHGELSGGFS